MVYGEPLLGPEYGPMRDDFLSRITALLDAPRDLTWRGAFATGIPGLLGLGDEAPASGAELLGRLGMDTESTLTQALGLGTEIVGNPLSWATGPLAKLLGLGGRAVAPAARVAAGAGDEVGGALARALGAAAPEASAGRVGLPMISRQVLPETQAAAQRLAQQAKNVEWLGGPESANIALREQAMQSLHGSRHPLINKVIEQNYNLEDVIRQASPETAEVWKRILASNMNDYRSLNQIGLTQRLQGL